MRLLETTTRVRDGWARLTGVIERPYAGDTVELYYEYPEEWSSFVFDGADPFVAAMVIPAMMLPVESVHIDPPVSAMLLEGARMYSAAISMMRADTMHAIELTATNPVARPEKPAAHVGAFFSLGVDSFHTLLTHIRGLAPHSPRVTHLIHLQGLQEPLSRERDADDTEQLVRSIAEEVGLPLITGRTNLRDVFIEPRWGRFHGAGLASVGLSLSRGIGRLQTPSAHSYANLEGIGCHPLIDPFWSSELLRVRVDGAERNRRDKILEVVGKDPLAQKHLRVCLKNLGGNYNCGRCQKCIRTMLTLQLMGELENVETFPDEVTPEVLRLLHIRSRSEHVHAREVYDYALQVGAPRWMKRRLRKIIRRYENREAVEMILSDSPLRSLLNLHDGLRNSLRRFRGSLNGRHATPEAAPPPTVSGDTSNPALDAGPTDRRHSGIRRAQP